MRGLARLATIARQVAPAVTYAGLLKPELEAKIRPKQRPPDGDWLTWLLLAGRGFGKTFALAHFVLWAAERWPGSRGYLAARTTPDVRDVMVYGESGIMSVAARPPRHVKTERRLEWPNGSSCLLLSADEPDQGRGPQYHWGANDEIMAWPGIDRPGSLWSNCQMGLRLPAREGWEGYAGPVVAIATTPRPKPLLRKWLKDWEKNPQGTTRVTRGHTRENEENLDPTRLAEVVAEYEGTRWGRQELAGELLTEAEGALWSQDLISEHRFTAPELPVMSQVYVGVDPSTAEDGGGDACGIVVVGVSEGLGHLYVLGDYTLNGGPATWASKVVEVRNLWRAELGLECVIVAEANNGGGMVAQTIAHADPEAPVQLVHASKSKRARAEPISLLYEQGLVHHVGTGMQKLEDEMVSWGPFETKSPNRIDALVWACTQLRSAVKARQVGRILQGRADAKAAEPNTVDREQEATRRQMRRAHRR